MIRVVENRSYSRNSGWTALDTETGRSGRAARMRAAIRCSWSGLTNENNRQTARLRIAPLAFSSSISASISVSDSGSTTSPPGPMRSRISNRNSRLTSGGGASTCRS